MAGDGLKIQNCDLYRLHVKQIRHSQPGGKEIRLVMAPPLTLTHSFLYLGGHVVIDQPVVVAVEAAKYPLSKAPKSVDMLDICQCTVRRECDSMDHEGHLPTIHKIRYNNISCTIPIFLFMFPILWLRHWIALMCGMRISTYLLAAMARAFVSVASCVALG